MTLFEGSVAALWDEWAAEDAFGNLADYLAPFGSNAPAVTFPDTPLTIRVRIALGADPAADPATWLWEDITSYVRYQQGITVAEGRPDEGSVVQTSQMTLTLDNRDGRFARRNPLSPYYGLLSRSTPVWVTVDPGSGEYDLAKLFVKEWPVRWDRTATDSTTQITCSSTLRLLS